MHPTMILLPTPRYDWSSKVVIDNDDFLYLHDYERYCYEYLSKILYHQVAISSLLVQFSLPIIYAHVQAQSLQSQSD